MVVNNTFVLVASILGTLSWDAPNIAQCLVFLVAGAIFILLVIVAIINIIRAAPEATATNFEQATIGVKIMLIVSALLLILSVVALRDSIAPEIIRFLSYFIVVFILYRVFFRRESKEASEKESRS